MIVSFLFFKKKKLIKEPLFLLKLCIESNMYIYILYCSDILLSLVRTKSVGHIRDVRRLIVAMSRARLGLYVFCRLALFKNCYELMPTFDQLVKRPDKLHLKIGEMWPASREVDSKVHLRAMVRVSYIENRANPTLLLATCSRPTTTVTPSKSRTLHIWARTLTR